MQGNESQRDGHASDPVAPAEDYSKGVIAQPRLRQLMQRSDGKGLRQLGLHLLLILCTGSVVAASRDTVWLWPAMFVHGIALVFLFAPLHETIHRTAFHSRWLNDAVAWGCGLVVILGPNFFRAFHFAHHRFTQDPKQDPECSSKDVTTYWGYLRYLSGVPYWVRSLTTLTNAARGHITAPFIAPRVRAAVVRESRILVGIYGSIALLIATGVTAPLVYWLGPILLAQPLVRAWLLAEHTGCEFSSNMFTNTRTVYANPIIRFLTWKMPYHVEHHAFPGIPFHALQEANKDIAGHIKVEASGYSHFHRQWLRQLEHAG